MCTRPAVLAIKSGIILSGSVLTERAQLITTYPRKVDVCLPFRPLFLQLIGASGDNIDNMRGIVRALATGVANFSWVSNPWKVLSQGLMIGSALWLTAFSHRGEEMYCYISWAIFISSAVTYNIMNRTAVVRYFYLLTLVILLAFMLSANHRISSTDLLERSPLLVMLMSLAIDELGRLQPLRLPTASDQRNRLPSAYMTERSASGSQILAWLHSVTHGSIEPRDDCPPQPVDHLTCSMDHPRNVRAASPRSSDMSLSSGGRDSLPSRWDPLTKAFFPKSGAQDSPL
ncbi:hypothetical protein GGR56DRAFT_199473 [Xylariaceae sp. FL0804]|nr:hypothetical protein GGR56DRAFT_199473 [Xylariaceae sp. FL0804]